MIPPMVIFAFFFLLMVKLIIAKSNREEEMKQQQRTLIRAEMKSKNKLFLLYDDYDSSNDECSNCSNDISASTNEKNDEATAAATLNDDSNNISEKETIVTKSNSNDSQKNVADDIFTSCDTKNNDNVVTLSEDVIIHICQYLHPKSLTTLACCNSSYWSSIMKGNSSFSIGNELWKALWYRDFGHVLLNHDCIRQNIYRISFDTTVTNNNKNYSSSISRQNPILTDMNYFMSFFNSSSSSSKVETEGAGKNPIDDEDDEFKDDNNEEEEEYNESHIYTLIDQAFSSSSYPSDNNIKHHNCKKKISAKIRNSCLFYFEFQECYLDYVLAGLNTPTQCYLGLHGHIVNFTDFLSYHPGRAEPIMIYCGGDATDMYEDFHPHSKAARKMITASPSTKKNPALCNIVNTSCCSYDINDFESRCGLSSFSNLKKEANNNDSDDKYIPMGRYPKTRSPPALLNIRKKYLREKEIVDAYVKRYGSKLRRQRQRQRHNDDYEIHGNRIITPAATTTTTSSTEEEEEMNNTATTASHNNSTDSMDPPPLNADIRSFYDPFHRRWYGWYNDATKDWTPIIICDLPNTNILFHK